MVRGSRRGDEHTGDRQGGRSRYLAIPVPRGDDAAREGGGDDQRVSEGVTVE